MLDSLGSTLSQATIDSFFIRNGKKPYEDHLTFAQAVQCLENELGKPDSEKKRIDLDGSDPSTMSGTPNVMTESESRFMKISIGDLDFSGPGLRLEDRDSSAGKPSAPPPYPTEPPMMPVAEVAVAGDPTKDNLAKPGGESGSQLMSSSPGREMSYSSSDAEADDSSGSSGTDAVERVINVKNCPLCHRPRLNSKAEVDIVTHLAVCASQDWAKVDQIVVGNFVTASQAQRKWYTKIITKVSSGDYKLGAVSTNSAFIECSVLIFWSKNSANIIVQNRMTGQLEEEKMQVYVRLGIRLLYKVSALDICPLASIRYTNHRARKAGWKGLEVRVVSVFFGSHDLNLNLSSQTAEVTLNQTRNQIRLS